MKKKIRISKAASKIVEDALSEDNMYNKVWQAYAMVGDDKAVGIFRRQEGYTGI